jgi:hypothetical protein
VADRPAVDVAVILRKSRTANRWVPWQWQLDEVVENEATFGTEPRLLYKGDDGERWLHPNFRVELYRDDAEGYYLNVTTPAPCWFVLWRMDAEATLSDEPIPRPVIVTLSYHDAGRWLDAQETVEQVPAPPHIVEWMARFAEAHYTPEPRKRKRPESFRRLEDRFGQPASVSTGKKYGGGGEGNG